MKKTVTSFILAGLLLTGIVSVAGAGEIMPVPKSGNQGAAVSAGQGLFASRMNRNETARQMAATMRDKMAAQREQGLQMAQKHQQQALDQAGNTVNKAQKSQQQALDQAGNTVNKAQQARPMAGSFQNHEAAGFRGQAIRQKVRVQPRFR